MNSRQTSHTVYALAMVALAVALVASAVRAQSTSFYTKRTEIQRQAALDRSAAQLTGDANQQKLYTLYPTPEILLAKPVTMAAGSTASLSLVGKFSGKTTFVSGNDGLTLTNAVVAANSLKATISAAADLPPSWVRIYAFAPVSGAAAWTPAVFVGSPLTFKVTATNGWIIKLAPEAPVFKITEPGTAMATYKAEFFKPGAMAPFETTTGSLTIEAEAGQGSYSFMMSEGNSGSAAAEVQDLTVKMMSLAQAGKVSSTEFAAIQQKIEAAQARYMKEMEAMMKDPSLFQKKKDDFGCSTINVSIRAGQISGNVNCGKNVGSSLEFTGSR